MFNLILLAFCIFLALSHSISFIHPLPAGKHYCYYETMRIISYYSDRNSKFTWEIEPMNSTIYEFKTIISVDFVFPYYYKKTQFGKEKIKLSRMVPTTNKYTFCFTNFGQTQTFFKIKFAKGAEVMDYSAGPSLTDHQNTIAQIQKLQKIADQIQNSIQDTQKLRITNSFNFDEMVKITIAICCISIIVLLVMNTIVYIHLKDFILNRKLM